MICRENNIPSGPQQNALRKILSFGKLSAVIRPDVIVFVPPKVYAVSRSLSMLTSFTARTKTFAASLISSSGG